jgi:hypothetical protein
MCLPFTHHWEVFATRDIQNAMGDSVGTLYILCCSKCGDIKEKKMLVKVK